MEVIEMKSLAKKIVSPNEFLSFSEAEKSNIKGVRILPPKVGDGTFGKIEVFFRHAVYSAK